MGMRRELWKLNRSAFLRTLSTREVNDMNIKTVRPSYDAD
jgi:hypothetical protein